MQPDIKVAGATTAAAGGSERNSAGGGDGEGAGAVTQSSALASISARRSGGGGGTSGSSGSSGGGSSGIGAGIKEHQERRAKLLADLGDGTVLVSWASTGVEEVMSTLIEAPFARVV